MILVAIERARMLDVQNMVITWCDDAADHLAFITLSSFRTYIIKAQVSRLRVVDQERSSICHGHDDRPGSPIPPFLAQVNLHIQNCVSLI
jgi:hypothetical protein